ncbi:MAG: hypothetical protein LLF76_08750 [Planctomycetaceae bacterium]|nr:hypothetical protein [Planctomycetaceae bacterium]
MENEQRSSSQSPAATKLCPFCAERIQLLAIKCRYCGEFLDRPPAAKPSSKWYYSNLTMIGSLLTLGPLALPLVWANPRFKVWVKAVITAATIAFTLLLCWAMVGMYVHLMDQIQSLGLMK